MKKIFHKNQVIITSLAFLIAIAGYISYDKAVGFGNKEKKEVAVSADAAATETSYDISMADDTEAAPTASTEVNVAVIDDTEQIKNPGEAVLTSTTPKNIKSAAQWKLTREQIRSRNTEALNAVIANESLTAKQRKKAVAQLAKLTDIADREAEAETTLEAKGFTNVVVSMDDKNCDVILDMGDVTDARCAQIEDIVKRKTGVAADRIIISPIGQEAEEAASQSLNQ